MKKLNTRNIGQFKSKAKGHKLSMLTCYDYQTAQLLNATELDLILVGDSLGNVVLGYDTTVEVSLSEMELFGRAVKKGAPNKFVVVDLPFGSYNSFEKSLENATLLFQKTKAEALKLEGAFPYQLEIIKRLTQIGIPVMGHIGLRPQSVHAQGGYYTHGKTTDSAQELIKEALDLEKAGCFAVVLECVAADVADVITSKLKIPTIGIGSGDKVDGHVLVINDLLGFGPQKPPSFCNPIMNLYDQRKGAIDAYLKLTTGSAHPKTSEMDQRCLQ